jgi:S1-C subfamily serine protease
MKRLLIFTFLAAISAAPLTAAENDACDKSFADVYATVAPSVVRVFSVKIDPFNVTNRVQMRVGSGVVFDDQHRVVTNAHLVHDARVVMVGPDQHSMQKAKVVGVDLVSDLAVILPMNDVRRFRAAPLGKSDKLRIGEEVIAIGHPLGLGKAASRGIVSGLGRILPLSPLSWMTPFIQTDAALSAGNSGGPLVTRCGQVVAINTLAGKVGQNINFAIPVDLVRELVPQLVSKGRVVRAWHGISGRLVSPALQSAFHIRPGFLIETVEPGSPADKVGLRGGDFPVVIGIQQYLLGGDVIDVVNGDRLRNIGTIVRIARSLRVGSKVKLEVWRGPIMRKVEVVLTERPVLPGDIRRYQAQSGLGR